MRFRPKSRRFQAAALRPELCVRTLRRTVALSRRNRYARRSFFEVMKDDMQETIRDKMPDALKLLKTRRSVKPMDCTAPAPRPRELDTLLTIASRVPDHGKLAPWRFIVFEGDARADGRRDNRRDLSRQIIRRRRRADRVRAQPPRAGAAGGCGRQPRRRRTRRFPNGSRCSRPAPPR